MLRKFYVYKYLRADGTPYYVGKGTGDRAYANHGTHITVPSKDRIQFVAANITESQAFAYERFWIAVYGRKDIGTGILRNRTDGGDGLSGYVRTAEAKQKAGDSIRKRRAEEPSRWANTTKATKGKPRTAEVKNKISVAKKGRPLSDSHKAAVSAANKLKANRMITDDEKQRRSEAAKAFWAKRKEQQC